MISKNIHVTIPDNISAINTQVPVIFDDDRWHFAAYIFVRKEGILKNF